MRCRMLQRRDHAALWFEWIIVLSAVFVRCRRVTNRHRFNNKETNLIVDCFSEAFDRLVCGGSLYVSLPTLHKKGKRGKEEINEGQCTLNGCSCHEKRLLTTRITSIAARIWCEKCSCSCGGVNMRDDRVAALVQGCGGLAFLPSIDLASIFTFSCPS